MNTSIATAWQNPIIGFNSSNDNYITKYIPMGTWGLYVGYFTQLNGYNYNRIIALNNDGTLYTRFTNNIGTGFNDVVFNATFKDGYFYLIGGFTSYNGTTQTRVIKLGTDGIRDSSFANNTAFTALLRGVDVDSSGYVYVTGDDNKLTCINTNGTTNWTKTLSSRGRRIAITGNNGILIGDFTTYGGTGKNRIVGFVNSDGSINATFNVGTGFGASAEAMTLDYSGNVWIVGGFTAYNGTTSTRIIKLNATTAAIVYSTATGLNSYTFDITYNDGKLYLGSDSTSYNGTTITRGGLVIDDDGIKNSIFTPKAVNGTSHAVFISSDTNGRIIISGSFLTYDGVTVNRIIQTNMDGTIAVKV